MPIRLNPEFSRIYRKRRRPWRQAIIEMAAGSVIALTCQSLGIFTSDFRAFLNANKDWFIFWGPFFVIPAYVINSQRARRRDYIRIHGDQVTWRIDTRRSMTAPLSSCESVAIDTQTKAITYKTSAGNLIVTSDFVNASEINHVLLSSSEPTNPVPNIAYKEIGCRMDTKRLLLLAIPIALGTPWIDEVSPKIVGYSFILALVAFIEPFFCAIIVKGRTITRKSYGVILWTISFDEITGASRRDYATFGNPVIDTIKGSYYLPASLENSEWLIALAQSVAAENRTSLPPVLREDSSVLHTPAEQVLHH